MRELSCDQNVFVRHKIAMKEYCESLLRICENSMKRRRFISVEASPVTLAETRSFVIGRNAAALLRHRLNSMFDGNREIHPCTVLALAIIPIPAITIASSLAIQRPADWSQDRLMLATIVNLERLAVRNGSAANQFGSN